MYTALAYFSVASQAPFPACPPQWVSDRRILRVHCERRCYMNEQYCSGGNLQVHSVISEILFAHRNSAGGRFGRKGHSVGAAVVKRYNRPIIVEAWAAGSFHTSRCCILAAWL